MTTLLKPSSLMPKGLQVQQVDHLTLFKNQVLVAYRLALGINFF